MGPPPPGYREALRAFKAGDYRTASQRLERVKRDHPADLRVRTLSAMIDARRGLLEESEQTLLQAIDDAPDERTAFGIRHQLALVHLQQRRLEDALQQIDHALVTEPNNPVLIAAKADMLLTANRRNEASALLEGRIDELAPDLTLATIHARLHARTEHRDRAIELLQRAIPDQPSPASDIRRAIYQLGALLENAQRYDEAFAQYERAGALAPDRYDPAQTEDAISTIIRTWTPDAIQRAHKPQGPEAPSPIFIVGMPRSGTSLTEQILTRHARIEGVGESDALSNAAALLGAEGTPMRAHIPAPHQIQPTTLQQARDLYTDHVLSPFPSAARVTDKHPMNFLRVGLIPILFPTAKVVHCVRDPRDTCVSCFAQHFVGDHPYANKLEHLGHFYRQYLRLMDHWRTTLNAIGAPIHDFVYEDAVTDPEPQTRALITFADLDWDQACLKPHESDRITWTHSNEQVRRPVYTSSAGRWQRFESHLGPLLAALGDAAQGHD